MVACRYGISLLVFNFQLHSLPLVNGAKLAELKPPNEKRIAINTAVARFVYKPIQNPLQSLNLRMSLFCSWWTMITYLGWSLLGIAEDFDPLKATDFPSESLARILYAGFLIMGAILLINMLIALLSNTYQRIKVR